MKEKIVAALLAFFIGSFGGHRFYLGQTGRGVLYLLFCWTMIPWLISIIDFIVLLSMSQERFDMLYNPQMFLKKNIGAGDVRVADELEKLDTLFQKGVITFEEFETLKARLM